MFCLSYFALNKHIINTATCFFPSSRVPFNQHFCQWRCFSFYWLGKREFGKFTNGIPVIGSPAPPTPTPAMKNSMVMLIIFIFLTILLFMANLFQKIKIVCWSWNLEPRLIWLRKIRWWCFFVLDLFCKYYPKIPFGILISPSTLLVFWIIKHKLIELFM